MTTFTIQYPKGTEPVTADQLAKLHIPRTWGPCVNDGDLEVEIEYLPLQMHVDWKADGTGYSLINELVECVGSRSVVAYRIVKFYDIQRGDHYMRLDAWMQSE